MVTAEWQTVFGDCGGLRRSPAAGVFDSMLVVTGGNLAPTLWSRTCCSRLDIKDPIALALEACVIEIFTDLRGALRIIAPGLQRRIKCDLSASAVD